MVDLTSLVEVIGWNDISDTFTTTRSPTGVASEARKVYDAIRLLRAQKREGTAEVLAELTRLDVKSIVTNLVYRSESMRLRKDEACIGRWHEGGESGTNVVLPLREVGECVHSWMGDWVSRIMVV